MTTKLVSARVFWSYPDPSVYRKIYDNAVNYKATHLAYFENKQFDSSQFGAGCFLPIGPNNTFKTVEELEGKWLNDLPSVRQYFQFATEFNIVETLKTIRDYLALQAAKDAGIVPHSAVVGKQLIHGEWEEFYPHDDGSFFAYGMTTPKIYTDRDWQEWLASK